MQLCLPQKPVTQTITAPSPRLSLLTSLDRKLFFSNLAITAFAADFAATKSKPQSPANTLHLGILAIAFIVNAFYQQRVISNLPCVKNASKLEKSLVQPKGYFIGNVASVAVDYLTEISLPTLPQLISIRLIAKNSFENLKNCARNFHQRPVASCLAGCVHIFNSALPLLSMLATYLPSNQNPLISCSEPHIQGTLIEKLANPILDPQNCPNHAKWILQGDQTFDDAKFAQKGCSYVRELFRKLAPHLHPDRNVNNRQAQAAFQNLGLAKETLCGR